MIVDQYQRPTSVVQRRFRIEHLYLTILTTWIGFVYFSYWTSVPSFSGIFSPVIQQLGLFHLWHGYTLKIVFALGLACWIAWVTLESGRRILLFLLPQSEMSTLEERVFAVGLGIGSISVIVLLLGALQLWYRNVFASLLIGATVFFLVKRTRTRPRPPSTRNTSSDWWIHLGGALLALVLLVSFVGATQPEIFYDSLHYHLAVPNLYLLNHGIYKEPNFALAGFVMAVQMFWALPLVLGNTIAIKILHVALGVLLFFAFLAFERRYLAPGAALLGALIFLCMPLVGFTVIKAGIDVAWTALQFLAVYALTRAIADDHDQVERHRWIRLAGILTGLAASCKYVGFAAIPLGGIIILWKRRRARELLVFTMYAVLVLSPYLIKNLVFYHNPVYPFGGTWIGDPRINVNDWAHVTADTGTRNLSQQFSTVQSALKFVFHPWFLTMPDQHVDTYIGPVLLSLLPMLLLVRPRRSPSSMLGLYASGLWFTWLFTSSLVRYSLPALALICLLSANAILMLRVTRFVRQGLVAACLAGVCASFYVLVVVLISTDGWRVLSGIESEDHYLSRPHSQYPAPDYEVLQWMNNNLPPGSKVMMAGDGRSFYSRVPVIPASPYDPQPVVLAAQKAQSGADLAHQLRQRGVTHLAVNLGEAIRTESYNQFSWDAHSWKVFDEFWRRYAELIWINSRSSPTDPQILLVFRFRSESETSEGSVPQNPFEAWKP